MKLVSIVGARPQFVKAAAFSRVVRERHTEVLVHTGQHYDYAMSGAFFDGLPLPLPDFNLNIGSASDGSQTGAMLAEIEKAITRAAPDVVVIYGDTNSTLAGALAAAKLGVPVAHIEAGLRSYDRAMPEEVNRVVADHVSDLLFCPSETAVSNLQKEGITDQVELVGDIMLDVLLWAKANGNHAHALSAIGVKEGGYVLATVHRKENTDNVDQLRQIVDAFNRCEMPVVFPIHPRTRKAANRANLSFAPNVQLLEPISYLEMVALSRRAKAVLTDSGGLQKEAYWLGVPCLTLRDETEWTETVEHGWNRLVGCEPEKILGELRHFAPPTERPTLYGDGSAAAKCVAALERLPSKSSTAR